MRKELKDKLTANKQQLERVLATAQAKQKSYESRLVKGVACLKSTYYGDVQEAMENNMRARYHWARWSLATRAITRRLNRVNRLLTGAAVKSTAKVLREKGLGQLLFTNAPAPTEWGYNMTTTTTGG